MDASLLNIMETCVRGSDEDRITFPEVIVALMEAGVERYHADFCRAETTFYMPDGASHNVAAAAKTGSAAHDFSADTVAAAIREIQAQKIDYTEFCKRIIAAGCIDYWVYIVGRRAIYFGRNGDSYSEPFPGR